ncbi:MAG: hypothetical protein MUE33_04770 [Cytophagaceae bacterium]|jgi:hypothetical protein|nr:hypothetical protein [Cytophagaceae bacterium]
MEGIFNPSHPVTSIHWTNAKPLQEVLLLDLERNIFMQGDNSNGNYYLYQDVNVSEYSGAIDGGTASFQFSYWFRTYNFNNDKGRVTVPYLDASYTVLTAYNSPNLTNLFSWTTYSDTRTAP